jgi:hypothetical protein
MTDILGRIRLLSFKYLIDGLSHTAALARAAREVTGSDKPELMIAPPKPAATTEDNRSNVARLFWDKIFAMHHRGRELDELQAAKKPSRGELEAGNAASVVRSITSIFKTDAAPERSYFENETMSDPGFYNPSGNVVDLNSEICPRPVQRKLAQVHRAGRTWPS